MKKLSLLLFLTGIALVVPSSAFAGLFGSAACLIKSPVRGLKVDDMSPEGFSVEWDFNVPPEIPRDIKVTIDGQDATPNIPWWMMLFDKGAGMTKAVHNVQPGHSYSVKVLQKSVCGEWSSETISVTTPGGLQETPISEAVATATSRVNQAVGEAPDAIADINDDYYWTETPVCDENDIFNTECTPQPLDLAETERDELAIWDPKYEGAKVDAIMDDGQRTFIKTNDGSPVTVYQEVSDGDGGTRIIRVPTMYDAVSGVTTIEGNPAGYMMFVGDTQIEISGENSSYGSAPKANTCDVLNGPCV